MKKLMFILVASLFTFAVADAQIFKYGLKAGIGFSSLSFEDVTGIDNGSEVYDLVTGDGVMGYHFGIQTRINLPVIFVQPEIYFNAGGGTVEQVVQNGPREVLNVSFSRVDIPLLVGLKLGPARLNAGPVGSYVINESNELPDLPTDFELFSKSLTWGFQAGIGVDISKISLDARYEGSLSRLGESLSIGNSNFALDARPRQWVISLGVWF